MAHPAGFERATPLVRSVTYRRDSYYKSITYGLGHRTNLV